MALPRFPILFASLALPTQLAAQAALGNVNDCTLIQDPIALRNCILRYGNVRTQPPATIESTLPPSVTQTNPAADPSDEIVEVPSTPARRAMPPGKRTEKGGALKPPVATLQPTLSPQTPPLPRPNPKDTITHIEQIDISKSK
ncbi:hypothetical protein [Methylorubrum sp. GM97]|uniref:hypothetical protein n=1 Tax=Methylorubrum sp. GM97 TaxID=2938232 RepID=UPI0021C26F63|nr:hypothetical protein [Methylorubrum sp. GM97]